jgi:exonuclease SbcC
MGSGKSSVMDAISFALFGTFPALERRKLKLIDLFRMNEINSSVSLVFKWNGSHYKVERKISKGKKKVESEAQVFKDDELTDSGPVAVSQFIEQLLAVDYDLFTRAIYSEQNNIDFFLTLDPRRRKQELDTLLGLDRFEEARSNTISVINRIKQNKKLLETQYDPEKLKESKENLSSNLDEEEKMKNKFSEIEKSIEEKQKQLNELKSNFDSLQKNKIQFDKLSKEKLMHETTRSQLDKELSGKRIEESDIDKTKKSLEEKRSLKVQLTKETRELDSSISTISKDIGSIESKIKKIESDEKKLSLAKAELAQVLIDKSIEQLQKDKEELEKEAISLLSEKKSLNAQNDELTKMLKNLKPDLSNCPICDNPLGEKGINHIIEEKNRKIEIQKKRIEKIEQQIDLKKKTFSDLSKRIKQAESLATNTSSLNKEIQDKEASITSLKGLNLKLSEKSLAKEKLQKQIEEIDPIIHELTIQFNKQQELLTKQKQLLEISNKLELTIKELNGIQFNEGEFEKQRKRIEDLRIEYEKTHSEKTSTTKQLDLLKEMIKQIQKEIEKSKSIEEEIKQYATLEEQLLIFKNALLETQTSMRSGLSDAINAAMNEIWNIFYPYQNYPGIRLCVSEKDYRFELQDRDEWKNLESIASGGERACAALTLRVALAMVLTPNLSWLILDEPTHNLDTEAVLLLSETLQTRVPEVVAQTFVITHEEGLMGADFSSSYRLNRDKDHLTPTKIEQI